MNIVPSDSRYIPLTQQKYCCVPTCIQIVMLRHNIPLVPAELLGYEMGLIVPPEDLPLFWHARTGNMPPAGWGTQISKPEFSPNIAFKKMNIPLRMDLKLINEFSSVVEFTNYLFSVEKIDSDLLVCFDYGTLFGTNFHGGHVCVLDHVFPDKGLLRIIDTETKVSKWREVKISKMYQAMQYHGPKKSGGFWELIKI